MCLTTVNQFNRSLGGADVQTGGVDYLAHIGGFPFGVVTEECGSDGA
jgi:membrane associated rhomboid family serine protease